MNWATRRRTVYILGIALFFSITLGIPTAIWLYEPPTCFDGKQNQDETSPDTGGPCVLLDAGALHPYSVLWSRAFPARPGSYNALAYVENSNAGAGIRDISYLFKLYDDRGVLVAERRGLTSLVPGGITPVFEGAIYTGNRTVTRAFFEFTSSPPWERVEDPLDNISVSNRVVSATQDAPRLAATAENAGVRIITDITFVATIFDTAGNAFASSATLVPRLEGGEKKEIVFVWSEPFAKAVSRVDILPLVDLVVAGN